MAKNLWIGSLPATMDDATFQQVFGAYGTITRSKLLAPSSRGQLSAVVDFSTPEEAQWIVENLNGNIPQGLTETVIVKFKDAPAGGAGGGGGGYGGGGGDWGAAGGNSGKGGSPYGGAAPAAGSNLFIGSLPGDMDDATFQTIFGAYGTVTKHRLMPPGAGGKRAALAEFSSPEEAKWIVENLNGNIPQGLAETVVVKFKDAPAGGAGGGDGGWGKAGGDGGKGGSPFGGKGPGTGCTIKVLVDGLLSSGAMPGGAKYQNDENALYVGGLPYDTTDHDMYLMFSPFGPIAPRGVRAMKGDDSPCKGFGFVNFLDPQSAQAAVATLNGTQLPDGKCLKVSIKGPGGGGGKGKGGF